MAVRRRGSDLHLRVSGELDVATVPELSARITELTRPDDATVWLDLSGVTFCGSVGVALVVKIHQDARGRGGKLLVYCPSPAVIRTLEACNVLDHLTVWTI